MTEYAAVGNTHPPVTAICRRPDGSIEDLSNATVRLHAIERRGVGVPLDVAATKPNGGADGKATYVFLAGDLSPGTWRWEFEATWPAETPDRVMTFPNKGYNFLVVKPRLVAVP